MGELKVEYVETGKLKTYANNAKIHTAEQVEQIKKSIEEFGFNDPIAVWHDNEIIEGHGRLIAATELGLETVPIIRLDELTDEQRKAYMLVHNKLTMDTDFDFEILNEELASIQLDMAGFGFEIGEADDEEIDDSYVENGSQFHYKEQYGVIVMCTSEADQEDIYNRLVNEGYECKVVAV